MARYETGYLNDYLSKRLERQVEVTKATLPPDASILVEAGPGTDHAWTPFGKALVKWGIRLELELLCQDDGSTLTVEAVFSRREAEHVLINHHEGNLSAQIARLTRAYGLTYLACGDDEENLRRTELAIERARQDWFALYRDSFGIIDAFAGSMADLYPRLSPPLMDEARSVANKISYFLARTGEMKQPGPLEVNRKGERLGGKRLVSSLRQQIHRLKRMAEDVRRILRWSGLEWCGGSFVTVARTSGSGGNKVCLSASPLAVVVPASGTRTARAVLNQALAPEPEPEREPATWTEEELEAAKEPVDPNLID